jgi:hypothetical protein
LPLKQLFRAKVIVQAISVLFVTALIVLSIWFGYFIFPLYEIIGWVV